MALRLSRKSFVIVIACLVEYARRHKYIVPTIWYDICSDDSGLVYRKESWMAGRAGSGRAWMYKSGDDRRMGVTDHVGPRDLNKALRWSRRLYDVGYSSNLIDEDSNVYTIPISNSIYKFDAYGNIKWEYKMPVGNSGNPSIWNKTLYITDYIGVVHAIDTASGQARWIQRPQPCPSPGNYAILAGEGLVFVHGMVKCETPEQTRWTAPSVLVALDPVTGEERWRARTEEPYFNIMPAFADKGNSIVYTDQDGGIHKRETQTGNLLWSVPGYPFPVTPESGWGEQPPGGAPRGHGAMALVDEATGTVFSSGNPTRSSGRVRAHRLTTGEVLWETAIRYMMGNAGALKTIDGVPVLVVAAGITALHPIPESVAPFYGVVYGLDARDGRILWTYDADPHYEMHSAGSVVEGRCYRPNMPDAFGPPTIDGNGTVYIGWHGGWLYALDGRDGSLISKFYSGEGAQANPAIGPAGELVITMGRTTHSFWPDAEG